MFVAKREFDDTTFLFNIDGENISGEIYDSLSGCEHRIKEVVEANKDVHKKKVELKVIWFNHFTLFGDKQGIFHAVVHGIHIGSGHITGSGIGSKRNMPQAVYPHIPVVEELLKQLDAIYTKKHECEKLLKPYEIKTDRKVDYAKIEPSKYAELVDILTKEYNKKAKII